MIITGSKGYRVSRTKTVSMLCPRCNNVTDHVATAYPRGLQLGFWFLPERTQIGLRSYYLKCPICGNLTKKISLSELRMLRRKNLWPFL